MMDDIMNVVVEAQITEIPIDDIVNELRMTEASPPQIMNMVQSLPLQRQSLIPLMNMDEASPVQMMIESLPLETQHSIQSLRRTQRKVMPQKKVNHGITDVIHYRPSSSRKRKYSGQSSSRKRRTMF